MGRCTRYRNRVAMETGSVEAKGIGGMLVRELRTDFGLSKLESEILASRSIAWLRQMQRGILPGQVVIDAPATACIRLIRQQRLEVRVTVVDNGIDGALWREYGLEMMQRARAVRVIYEIRRQGCWANLAEVAALLNLTPNALQSRLRPLREAGVWLPHLRSERPDEGQLPLEAHVIYHLLAGNSTESIRGLIGLTISGLESLIRTAVLVWQYHDRGESDSSIALLIGRAEVEVESIIEVIKRGQRRKVFRQWQRMYGAKEQAQSDSATEQAEPYQILQREHGMSVVSSRLYIQRLHQLAEQLDLTGATRKGETIFFAISAEEGARAKLSEAQLVPIRLNYITEKDLLLGPRGKHPTQVSEMKFARILRYTTQARAQGGLLTLPDLSMLLGIHVEVIQRLIASNPQVVVPTRGRVKDIGRGVTHRRTIVELYLQMHTETEIVDRTAHSYESVEAYLREFARIMTLADQGMNAVMIRRVTGRSMSLVEAYLELYRKYEKPEYHFRLAQLRRVFAREELLAERGKKNRYSPIREDN